ncbi:MAG: DNA polymerase III subunit alpha [Flavobacteriales bacterium]|nr:DNA polymerase III subunit alpha [Flavobacteriales bacterium]MCX7768078.1 DNA polymerase III subunit alpha [Flavobacteriales bacterium]MDW8410356.1 DNA polymerase III subunit alpha [Flavobacteriales bacterium]
MFLHCHSHFSFGWGTLSPEKLVELAAIHGARWLALTDINNTSAWLTFHEAARQACLHPVSGIDFRQGDTLLYIGLARSNRGWASLCHLLTDHLRDGKPLPLRAPEMEDVWVIYPWRATHRPSFQKLRPEEWWGIPPEDTARLAASPTAIQERCVAWHTVSFAEAGEWRVHQALRAIHLNTLRGCLPMAACACPHHHFVPVEHLVQRYARFPTLLSNTEKLAMTCHTDPQPGVSKNRCSFTGCPQADFELLRKLCYEGLAERYGSQHREATERLEKELHIIQQMGFCTYFLINWDIVNYAKHRGFRHVGRGSGGNSIAAYCLGITDTEPLALNLFFERFINPHRSSPPDFDLDFSWKERDAVIDYIYKRYGPEHTALLATYSTYQLRQSLRELGRAFGLPAADIERLSERQFSLQDENMDNVEREIVALAERLQEMPHHLSIHAGGIVISERPLYEYGALQMPPKGFHTTQFDMYTAEDLGLYKYDILSQRGLGHIREAITLITTHGGQLPDFRRMDTLMQDPTLNDMLARGDTVGCFYIESPAMRQLLRKLRCRDYSTLVAASSIIRPGVARSGMMQEYIRRHLGLPPHLPSHPVLQDMMPETYGIMVYQEDVLRVAHGFAGLGLAEADILRRGMSGKFRSRAEFERVRRAFFEGAQKRGHAPADIAEVWRQIESFSGYSFSKAHSASFAVESYQSLALKAYHPIPFILAVLNNFGGFYDTWYYLLEARRLGAEVEAPDVQRGAWLSTLHPPRTIVLGFIHIKGLEAETATRIEQARQRRGPFQSLDDFLQRTGCTAEQTELLIRAGAFRSFSSSRPRLLWENALAAARRRNTPTVLPFSVQETPALYLPDLSEDEEELLWDQWELLGFPLCNPFRFAAQRCPRCITAEEMPTCAHRRICMTGWLVCTKDTTTVRGEPMGFGTWVDQEGLTFDSVHFSQVYRRHPFRGRGLYHLVGVVREEFGVYTLEVEEMEIIPLIKHTFPKGHPVLPRLQDGPHRRLAESLTVSISPRRHSDR